MKLGNQARGYNASNTRRNNVAYNRRYNRRNLLKDFLNSSKKLLKEELGLAGNRVYGVHRIANNKTIGVLNPHHLHLPEQSIPQTRISLKDFRRNHGLAFGRVNHVLVAVTTQRSQA